MKQDATATRWIDDRMRRAVRQVLAGYTLSEADDNTHTTVFGVAKGRRKYAVTVDKAWRHPPSCTCPDIRRVGDKRGRGYCKHVIAVLLSSEQHRHQLIDLLL